MRATILCGFVGLISISSFTGCGAFQGWRSDGTENSNGVARKIYVAPDSPMPTAPVKVSPNVAVFKNNDDPAPATLDRTPRAAQTPATLPDISALPKPVDQQKKEPAPSKIETTPPAIPGDGAKAPVPVGPGANKVQAAAGTGVNFQMGHSENFQTVTGTVEIFRKTWRLRYAGVDQDDPFGGVVVLDGGAELNQLRDGMQIRVRGTLVPAVERTGSAHYRVQALEILN